RRPASAEPKATDVDGHSSDLATQRVPDRIADGRIDLPGDLGDGYSVRDGQAELDVDRLAEADRDPRLRQPEPLEQPLVRTRREPGDAVRPEGRGADEIGHGLGGDERSSGLRVCRHAGESSGLGWDRRRRDGTSRGRVLFYRSVRALPGSDTSITTTLEDHA